MRMSHFVVRDAINPALAATSREGAIREMVQGLAAAGQFLGADTFNASPVPPTGVTVTADVTRFIPPSRVRVMSSKLNVPALIGRVRQSAGAGAGAGDVALGGLSWTSRRAPSRGSRRASCRS